MDALTAAENKAVIAERAFAEILKQLKLDFRVCIVLIAAASTWAKYRAEAAVARRAHGDVGPGVN